MTEWSFDLPGLRVYSSRYEAILQPQENGGYSVLTVRCRTDTREKADAADNLGEPKTVELAKSVSAALAVYLTKQRC